MVIKMQIWISVANLVKMVKWTGFLMRWVILLGRIISAGRIGIGVALVGSLTLLGLFVLVGWVSLARRPIGWVIHVGWITIPIRTTHSATGEPNRNSALIG